MSRDLDRVARENLKKAKKEAKNALREEIHNEKIKNKLEKLRKKQEAKVRQERQEILAEDINVILNLYNRKGAFHDGENAIVELEDGNIQGCINDKYFYTYQKGGEVFVKVLSKGEDLATNYDPRDGEPVKTECVNVIVGKVKRGNKIDSKTITQERYRKPVKGYDTPSKCEIEDYNSEKEIMSLIDDILVNRNTNAR